MGLKMKNKSLLIGFCNKILLLIAFGFVAKQLFIHSFIKRHGHHSPNNPISQTDRVRKSFRHSPHKSTNAKEKIDTSKKTADDLDCINSEIDFIYFKLDQENLNNEELCKIFDDLKKIENEAQKKNVANLAKDRIKDIEKQITICKQATLPNQKK